MRFWTTLGQHSLNSRRNWRSRNSFPYSIGGAVVLPRDSSRPFILAMVEATDADVAALGNALVMEYTQDITVAIFPEYLASGTWRNERHLSEHYNIVRDKTWVDEFNGSIRRVLNGVVGSVCTDCENILHRAAGACMAGWHKCTGKLFPEGSVGTLPPMGLYMTAAACVERRSFESYSITNLDTRRTIDSPLQLKGNSKAAFKGATTRYLKKTACTVCLFGDPLKPGKCTTCYNPQYCDGPYFDSDVHKEFPMVARENLRIMGTPVSMTQYQEEAVKHGPSWSSRAWRIDPELSIGFSGRGLALDLQVIQTRKSKNNYDHERTTTDQWPEVKRLFCTPVTVSKPATLFERLLLTLYAYGALNVRVGGSGGWGNNGWSCLYGVHYDDSNDLATLMYLLCSYKTSFQIKDIRALGQHCIGAYRAIETKSRSEDLQTVLTSRGTNKTAVKQFEELVGKLVQADKDVQAGKLDKMPSVAEL